MSNSSVVEIDFHNRKPNWLNIIVLGLLHVAAFAAFFNITKPAVVTAFILYYCCICWGIGLGYHRLHTHRAYIVPKWLEYFFALCGTMTLEGGPIFWVATHRIHHQKSDKHGDPHSPRDGVWWSHMGWIVSGVAKHDDAAAMGRFAPDLAKDQVYVWLTTYHWVPLALSGILLYLIGGLPMFLWAGPFRVVAGLHATWLVNSATHLWGQRRFDTTDDSRNNWWVALLTFGEGWHNNHHAMPASARHGLAWYELDISWLHIRLMERLGVATRVRYPRVEHTEAAAREAA